MYACLVVWWAVVSKLRPKQQSHTDGVVVELQRIRHSSPCSHHHCYALYLSLSSCCMDPVIYHHNLKTSTAPIPNAPTSSAPLGETVIAADVVLLLPPLLPFGLLLLLLLLLVARSSSTGTAARDKSAFFKSGMVSGTRGPVMGAGVASARVVRVSVVARENFIVECVGFARLGFG